MTLRHLCLACPALLLPVFIACDRSQPFAPSLEAGASGAGGPSVRAPSNTNAVAASERQVDVSWQDNSTNESGFELWRSLSGLGGTFSKLAGTGANVTTYSNAGLSSVTQYCYRVRAFRTYDGKTSYSDFSNTACSTTPAPPVPSAPSATNAVPDHTTIAITWTDNAANEDGFRVERSLDNGTSWVAISTTVANVRSLTEGGRSSEQQACYRVIAFNTGGDSPPSNTDCTTPPVAPTGLTATGVDGPAIDLAWTDNSAVEDGYEVQRSVGGSWSVVATLPPNSTRYQDVGLMTETRYSYRVRANKDGGGAYSDIAYAVTATTPPIAPSGTDARPASSTVIDVRWTDNSTNEDGFRIERSTDGGTSWAVAATTGPSNAWGNVYDDGRTSEQRVCYRVVAFNGRGESPPSSPACTTPPAGPSNVTAIWVDEQTIEVTWTDNSGVEGGYEVLFSDGGINCEAAYSLPANSTRYVAPIPACWAPGWLLGVVATKDGGYSDVAWVW